MTRAEPAAAEHYAAEALLAFLDSALVALGLRADDAALCAEILLDADLRGVGTHGIANFAWHVHYGQGLRDGHVNARPSIQVLRDSPAAAAWDADRGFGPLVAHRAMVAAIDKASQVGVGLVTVRNGCHFGANAYYLEMATAADMVGWMMTSTPPAAVAPGGLDRVVGTNPLGVGVPSGDDHPFVLDMATTAIAGTRAVFAERAGTPLPWGVAVDGDGRVTTDPSARHEGGLLPLGSTVEAGSAKGFGLALVVDLFSGLLSGTGSGIHQRYSFEWRQGYWVLAFRVDLFTDADEFRRDVAATFDMIRRSRPADPKQPVRIPGDRAAESRRAAPTTGVLLPTDVVEMCRSLAGDIGVEFPEPT